MGFRCLARIMSSVAFYFPSVGMQALSLKLAPVLVFRILAFTYIGYDSGHYRYSWLVDCIIYRSIYFAALRKRLGLSQKLPNPWLQARHNMPRIFPSL